MPPSRASEVLALGLRFSAVSSADVAKCIAKHPVIPQFFDEIDAVLPFWTLIVRFCELRGFNFQHLTCGGVNDA